MSQEAAKIIINQLQTKKNSRIGFATGSTPERTYEILVEEYSKGGLDFSEVISVNLDEYLGIDLEHPQSYHTYMNKNLFDHINIKKENIHLPKTSELKEGTGHLEYDKILDKVGRRDIQILGIGHNGHIAFLEPDEKLFLRTRKVKLSDDTIEQNSRFFKNKEEVPTQAISMGIQDILNADHIILMANGEMKRDAIVRLQEVTYLDPQFPVSCLTLHPKVTVIVDELASK